MENDICLTPRILLEYFSLPKEDEGIYIDMINRSLKGLGLEEIRDIDDELPDDIMDAIALTAAYNVFCLTHNLEIKVPVFKTVNNNLMLSWTKTCFSDGKTYSMPLQMFFMKSITSVEQEKIIFFSVKDSLTGELFLSRDFLMRMNFNDPENEVREKNQKKEQPICTYVILDEHTGYYKIGRSKEPDVREKTLQAQKPTLSILYKTEKNVEIKLHNYFKNKRIRGEWFNLDEIDLDIIQGVFEGSYDI